MNNGRVYTPRIIWDHPRSKDAEFVSIWLWLWHNAAYSDRLAEWKGETVTLKPGQLICGRHQIAKETGVHESKCRRVIARLKTDQLIDQRPSHTSSLISIINYTIENVSDQPSDQQMTNSRPTSDQQVTTIYNKGNKGNKGTKKRKYNKRKERPPMKRPIENEVIEFVMNLGLTQEDGEYIFLNWSDNDWINTNTKRPIRNWKQTARKWKAAGYFPSQKKQKSKYEKNRNDSNANRTAQTDFSQKFKIH